MEVMVYCLKVSLFSFLGSFCMFFIWSNEFRLVLRVYNLAIMVIGFNT